MTAPRPIAGTNPYTLGYQKAQFDSWLAGGQNPMSTNTVLDTLSNPPAAGITAEVSPAFLFAENTNPPVGAGGNEGQAVEDAEAEGEV
jgi:hypothetical protein